MPSDPDALLRSLRRWLLVAVFLLGVGVVALADIAYVVADYQGGVLPAAVGVVGGTVALLAGASALASVAPSG